MIQARSEDSRISSCDGTARCAGEEFDHVVLSCVVDGARPSFLRDNRRMNVALSRAKKTLDIVCHASLPANLPVMAAMQTAASGGIVALGHPVTQG